MTLSVIAEYDRNLIADCVLTIAQAVTALFFNFSGTASPYPIVYLVPGTA